MNKTEFMKNSARIAAFLLTIFVIVGAVVCGQHSYKTASAAENESTAEKNYSNVTADLLRDSTFSVSKYPELESVTKDDDKLQVIALAESTDKDLFMYIYCPLVQKNQLIAQSVAVTFSSETGDAQLYYLTFLNAQNTLFKYKVKDYTVSEDPVRLYNIQTVWVEGSIGGYKVNKTWTFTTVGDNNSCTVDKGETYNMGVLGSAATTGVPPKTDEDKKPSDANTNTNKNTITANITSKGAIAGVALTAGIVIFIVAKSRRKRK